MVTGGRLPQSLIKVVAFQHGMLQLSPNWEVRPLLGHERRLTSFEVNLKVSFAKPQPRRHELRTSCLERDGILTHVGNSVHSNLQFADFEHVGVWKKENPNRGHPGKGRKEQKCHNVFHAGTPLIGTKVLYCYTRLPKSAFDNSAGPCFVIDQPRR